MNSPIILSVISAKTGIHLRIQLDSTKALPRKHQNLDKTDSNKLSYGRELEKYFTTSPFYSFSLPVLDGGDGEMTRRRDAPGLPIVTHSLFAEGSNIPPARIQLKTPFNLTAIIQKEVTD